jgi:16S rRNA (guanine966-N2)-methyltransferase
VRIVAGAARGRRLRVPQGTGTRPTADRVKEALFSSLQRELVGASVLDLYAGSGALGLEALSRGAARVTAVESDRRALRALRHNADLVGLAGHEVIGADVGRVLAGEVPGAPFGLVLLDPPYRTTGEELTQVLGALTPHLDAGALVVVERPARAGDVGWPPDLLAEASRRYGDTALHRARVRSGTVDGSRHIEEGT